MTMPEGVERFEVPPLEVLAAVTLHGQVIDTDGAPAAGMTIVGAFPEAWMKPGPGIVMTPAGLTDEEGRFTLAGAARQAVPGRAVLLLLKRANGESVEVEVTPTDDGEVLVTLPD